TKRTRLKPCRRSWFGLQGEFESRNERGVRGSNDLNHCRRRIVALVTGRSAMNCNFQKSLRGLDRLEQVRRRIACAVFFAVVASVSLTVHDARAQSCTPYGN